MQFIVRILFIAVGVLGVVACGNRGSESVNDPKGIVESIESPKSVESNEFGDLGGTCEEWRRLFDLLSDKDKIVLKKDGVVSGKPDDKYDDGYYLLSPNLVPDCDRRVVIGELLRKLIVQRDTTADKKFARRNSKEIVSVIRHIWRSARFSSDGLAEEKYTYLTYDGFKDDDIAPFIAELLKTEGISDNDGGLEITLVNRPLKLLKPVVMELLSNAGKERNVPQQVYFLIVLNQMDPKPANLSRLSEMTKNPELADETRKELNNIVRKFKSGVPIDYGDVEKLDMPLVVYEQAEN